MKPLIKDTLTAIAILALGLFSLASMLFLSHVIAIVFEKL